MNIYTMQRWAEDQILKIKIGQLVAPEVINQLKNAVPPHSLGYGGYFQEGEGTDVSWDTFEDLYMTFELADDAGNWRYLGNCVSGGYEPREGYFEHYRITPKADRSF